MSESPDDIDELRQQRMEELRDQADGQQGGAGNDSAAAQEAAREQAEAQQEALLKQHLTDGARQRLNAIEMSKPDFAKKVKKQLVTLAQSGRIQDRIDEDQMRELLQEMKPDSKSYNIRRR
ncbi:DNA-binding protein [Haloquadratum walsbyi]|jgi:DNA-binding TFAR19-related protein|uniref:DNA-binding protein J07HQW2_02575 n=1 Tax=Haloquadratum walsbyi J07HQW2 TaxID=1238425 RepID=U1PUP8_9EURY|nr:DNA-binding protein [Haloquadratum walsbyi]ERG96106.1 MAG: DNA-binding protein [Haloquadratum walsbyi J07HQW2]